MRGQAQQLSRSYAYWYRHRYRLTIHDPRYLESCLYDWELDWWTEYYLQHPDAINQEGYDPEFEETVRQMQNRTLFAATQTVADSETLPDDWENWAELV